MGGRGGSARLGKAAAGAQAKATQLNPKDMTAEQRAQRLKEIEAILESQKGTFANLHGAELLRAGLENEPLLKEKELLEDLNRVAEKGLPKYKAGDVVRSNGITAKIVDVGADGRALAEVIEGKLGTKGPGSSFVFKPESPFANGIEQATQATDEREGQAASPTPTEATPAKSTPQETQEKYLLSPEEYRARSASLFDGTESPAPTVAQTKATPQNKNSRFRYNGIKGDDGKLKLANYQKLDDGTITVTIRNYEDSLPDIQGSVKSKSTDTSRYGGLASEYDVITIKPGEPAYTEANAAYETSEARRRVNDIPQNKNSRFKYNGIKGDDGKLKLADYQKSDDGTITVTSRNHEGSLPDVSGSQKDNFQEATYHGPVNYDVITIKPGEPAYADANAAYETGQARAEAIRTGKAKKVDEILAKISREAEEKYQARVAEGKRIEEMSAPANTKYFDIDEEQARRGRESYSLFGYKEGSETAYYRQQVDYAFKLAAVAKEKTDDPELQARADMLAERYSKKYAEWLNEKNKIDASYPSWIVAGPANYNTKKNDKKNARLDAHFKKLDEIESIKSEIQAVPYYKPFKPREEKIYTVKERTHEGADKYFKIERNKDVNRLQLKFDGKPPQEQREILKKHGFRWSPTQEAWQRQLTPNAEYSIDYVIRDFNKLTDNT